MNLDVFVASRQERWAELGSLLDRSRGRPERLRPSEILRLGQLYRAAAADLAVGRRRYRGTSELARLEELVGRARYVVYDTERGTGSFSLFVRRGYWRRVAERPSFLIVAAVLMFSSMALATVWSLRDPVRAAGVLPEAFQQGVQRSDVGDDLGLSGSDQAVFASAIFTNNIRVSFLAFAGGVLAGLGTAAVLLYNGLILGVVSGLVIGGGAGGRFAELVLPHGFLELSCIVVTAAAGFRIGWAVVEPGDRTRPGALVAETKMAVEVVLGTIPFLVVAGLVEGFLTPRGLGVAGATALGAGLGAAYWALVWSLGRAPRSVSQAGALFGPQIGPHAGGPEPAR